MSAPRKPTARDADAGATTSGRGSPFAVDLSGDRRTRSTIAQLVAGPIIWSLHFMVVYVVVEAGCTGEGPGLRVFDPPVPAVVTLVATAVAALACVATATWSFRWWRAARQEPEQGGGVELPDHGGAMAFGGFILSLLGIVTVLVVGLPALVLPAC